VILFQGIGYPTEQINSPQRIGPKAAAKTMPKAKKRGDKKTANFKDLIKRFREQHHALDKDDKELLQRWEEDDNAIDASYSIASHMENAAKIEGEVIDKVEALAWLIHIVLFVKHYSEEADQLSPKLTERRRRLSKLEKQYRNKLAKIILSNKVPLPGLPDALKKATARLVDIEKTKPADLPIRSSRAGSRRRTLFMTELSNSVKDLTGLRLDIAVAALTDIAFPRNEPTSTDAVRSATRPSTRKGRGGDPSRKSRNRSR
jgi:hypothetical protein